MFMILPMDHEQSIYLLLLATWSAAHKESLTLSHCEQTRSFYCTVPLWNTRSVLRGYRISFSWQSGMGL